METKSMQRWILPSTIAHIRFVHEDQNNKEFEDPQLLKAAIEAAIKQKPWLTQRGNKKVAVWTGVMHNAKYGSDRFYFAAEDSIKASQLYAFQQHLKDVCKFLAAEKLPYVKEIFGWLEVTTKMMIIESK